MATKSNENDLEKKMNLKSPDHSMKTFLEGMRDGIPIGLGYFAVAFGLGITAHNAGINAFQGFVMSFLNNASAGEYAGISAIKANASYIEIAILILVTNARYLLMSCALSQKLDADLPLWHRLLIGFDITDELFGISIAHSAPVPPLYMYGAYCMALPGWACGTAAGIIAGDVLPVLIVNALSAAIYGMFIATIIPAGRKDKTVMVVVLASFLVSGLASMVPGIEHLSESFRIILITLAITVLAALIKPISEEEMDSESKMESKATNERETAEKINS